MSKQIGIFISMVLCFLLVSCASRIVPEDSSKVVKPGIASVWAEWIKDKNDKYDMRLCIGNDNEKEGMIIMLNDINCLRGETRGSIRHTFFNTGERTMDFNPNELKCFNLVCSTPGAHGGDFVVKIQRISDNPKGDGATKGKVIAEGLVFTQSSRK